MGKTCSRNGRNKKYTQYFGNKTSTGENNLADRGVDVDNIKIILGKQVMKLMTQPNGIVL